MYFKIKIRYVYRLLLIIKNFKFEDYYGFIGIKNDIIFKILYLIFRYIYILII